MLLRTYLTIINCTTMTLAALHHAVPARVLISSLSTSTDSDFHESFHDFMAAMFSSVVLYVIFAPLLSISCNIISLVPGG